MIAKYQKTVPNGNCKQSSIIYQADVTLKIDKERIYIGLTEGPFKGYLRRKTITSQNVSSETLIKNFFKFVEKLCLILKILKFLHF